MEVCYLYTLAIDSGEILATTNALFCDLMPPPEGFHHHFKVLYCVSVMSRFSGEEKGGRSQTIMRLGRLSESGCCESYLEGFFSSAICSSCVAMQERLECSE